MADKKNLTASVSLEEHAWLEGLRNQSKHKNFGPWIVEVVKENEQLREANTKLKNQSSKAVSSDQHFVAKIHPRHASLVEAMREYLDEEQGLLNDDSILLWFARLVRAIKAQTVHIVMPNKTLNKNLVEQGQKAVDDGAYQNMNHFLSRMMHQGLSALMASPKTPKKEEKPSSWW